MRLKIVLIFIISILIPTALLSHFGLLAVRSEKAIIEKDIDERYEAIAGIVEGEIKATLEDMPEELLGNKQYLESVLLGEASMFKDQVKILDRRGRPIGISSRSFTSTGKIRASETPALIRPIKGLPYIIAVYERHPMLLNRLEEKKKGLYLYILLIAGSAMLILSGGLFTLWSLSKEWRLAKVKSDFVSHLSHDLRKPLTSIRMFSEMLHDNRVADEGKKREYYSIITKESERLTHLANNILDFARIEKGRKKYNFKFANVASVVSETTERFRRYMLDEPRTITLEIKDTFPEIKMDAQAVSQAVFNLLSNAVKYSPPDKAITLTLLKAKNCAVIKIIDQGIGVPRAEQKKIFCKYYRAPQMQVAEKEGSGLGLALVQHTAKAHNGRVTVESPPSRVGEAGEEGKGSKFSLILPLAG